LRKKKIWGKKIIFIVDINNLLLFNLT
jgi:hypothetical protein